MARKRIPTVGAGALNIAQVTPQVRAILAHRAKEAARREAAPVLAADRSAFGGARSQYKAEAASARGATSAVQDNIANIISGLGATGLTGKYKQQALGALTAQSAGAASSLPMLLAGAKEERGEQISDARQNLLEDRATMQQNAAQMFNSNLDEERGHATSFLKARQTAHKEAIEDAPTIPYAPTDKGREAEEAAAEAKKQVSLALEEAKRLLIAYPDEHPHDKSEWSIFAGTIADADEVSPWAAAKAVEILRKHAAKRAAG